MRSRKDIEKDGKRVEFLLLEVLLDLRDLSEKQEKQPDKKGLGGGLKTPTKK